MNAVLGVACLVVGILIGFGVGSKVQGPPPPTRKPEDPEPDPAQTPDTYKDADADLNDQQVLEELKVVLHGLLTTLTEAAERMQSTSDQYDAELSEQKDNLKSSLSLEDMKQLGEKLLSHIESMHKSNTTYREQLTTTNLLLKKQQDELDRLQRESGVDFLTGVPNRMAYEERMKEMINIARRHGNIFSLLVMDIDRFKSINDEFGHLAGDAVLQSLAQLVKTTSRASDFLARYGGEEFTYILPETTLDQAANLAEKLRKRIEDYEFVYGNATIPVTISGGLSTVIPSKDTGEAVFKRADAALYKAKTGGRNRITQQE